MECRPAQEVQQSVGGRYVEEGYGTQVPIAGVCLGNTTDEDETSVGRRNAQTIESRCIQPHGEFAQDGVRNNEYRWRNEDVTNIAYPVKPVKESLIG